ncbi:MAG: DUF4115 domain-containing protein [Gammaproteobacteria bacterium]|nr:DUF4115 domain-containing protein [Gammaproteobacteria bacterium]
MTELNDTEDKIEDEVEVEDKRVLSFGEHLYLERKRQNYSISDVANAIHLSEKIVDALERSDVSKLPGPTFVQGYLRIYAKYLGIPEALVLEEYAHAVPHKLETELEHRSTVRHQASSNSTFVKMVTVLLLVITIAAAFYAAFSYYKEAMVQEEETQLDNQATFSLPDTRPTAQDELADGASSEALQPEESEPAEMEAPTATDAPAITAAPEAPMQEPLAEVAADESRSEPLLVGEDVLELTTEEVTWLEVDDANGITLYYDLLQQNQSLRLKGAAPFRVFLGNAPPVTVRLNDVAVNIEKRIRANNIAQFTVSTDQQQVIFH